MQTWIEICNERYFPNRLYIICPNVVVRLISYNQQRKPYIKFHYRALTTNSFLATDYLFKQNAYKFECTIDSIEMPEMPTPLFLRDENSKCFFFE